jgi:hypothetical protein
MNRLHRRMAIGAIAAFAAVIASAHHSFVMFDTSKTVVLDGVIRKVELVNPHSWFWITVRNSEGGEELWGIEAGGPASGAAIARLAGMPVSKYFAPDQKVVATFYPLKDGRKGGLLITIRFEDGRVYDQGLGRTPPPAAGEPRP